jgi:methylthioribose-1-phosphate isomerase
MKKTQTYKNEASALKDAKKRGAPSITFMIAVGKPKMALPKRGQRTATNMMKKSSRGK